MHYEIFGAGQPLVMLHGWAMHSGVWRDFAQRLGEHYQVICIDLPGHGFSESLMPFERNELCQALAEAIPVQTFSLLGWSMGATLALALAELCPQRIRQLLLLSGNPCFLETPEWPGMSVEVFSGFSALLDRSAEQTLARFLALQVNGLEQNKVLLQALKQLHATRPVASDVTLKAGLKLLAASDLRQVVECAAMPLHFIFGDCDHLVPLSLHESLKSLKPSVEITIIEHAGHVAFLSHPDRLLAVLTGAIDDR